MIDSYSFGSMTINGTLYTSDLKIINGQVYRDWWRKSGHSVVVEDIQDILDAEPDYFVVGSGSSGLMKVSDRLQDRFAEYGIEVFAQPTAEAILTFNRLYGDGKNVTGGFRLTC
jgi:hypothetical protein